MYGYPLFLDSVVVMKLMGQKDQYREEFTRLQQQQEKVLAENEARRV